MRKTIENIVGTNIGIWEVLNISGVDEVSRNKIYHVRCKYCGFETDMKKCHIKTAKTCTHINHVGNIHAYYKWQNQRLASIFLGMKKRCYDPNCQDYHRYGGKGIKICDEWVNNPGLFETWSFENGYDDTLTIDRIKSDKDYCPENCRWVTKADNSKYATGIFITVDDETKTEAEWCRTINVSRGLIGTYIKRYGLNNTIEFIKRRRIDQTLKSKSTQSLYELYMEERNDD